MERMLVIRWPNEAITEIQVRDQLCEYRWKHSPPSDDELTPEFIAFRNRLQSIPGVDRVNIGKHDIDIERYEIFTAEEVVEAAQAIISEYTGKQYQIRWDDRRDKFKSSDEDWGVAAE